MSTNEEQKIVSSEKEQKMKVDSETDPNSSVDQLHTNGDTEKTTEEIQKINEEFV